MKLQMVKKTIVAIAMASTMMASQAFAGANLAIDHVTVNRKGETFSTICANTRGFYFEIGKPKAHEHLTVYGFGGEMPLNIIVKDLLFNGWKVKYGKTVNIHDKIKWMGHKAWTTWLKQLSFEHNFAVIVDWQTKMVYINQL